MTAQEIPTLHAARWGCELAYVYGKTRVGLEDVRVRPVEAIATSGAVVFLALLFLQVQRVRGRHRTLPEALAAHRQGASAAVAARRGASRPPAWRC